MADDKCYICLSNEEILRRPCINEKCMARACSSCLEQQYPILKNCGLCSSKMIVKQIFNYQKLLSQAIDIFVISILYLLHIYAIYDLFSHYNEKPDYFVGSMMIFNRCYYYIQSLIIKKSKYIVDLFEQYGKYDLLVYNFISDMFFIPIFFIVKNTIYIYEDLPDITRNISQITFTLIIIFLLSLACCKHSIFCMTNITYICVLLNIIWYLEYNMLLTFIILCITQYSYKRDRESLKFIGFAISMFKLSTQTLIHNNIDLRYSLIIPSLLLLIVVVIFETRSIIRSFYVIQYGIIVNNK